MPEFDGYTIDAKYQVLHGQGFDSNQHKAWQNVVDVCNEFKAADKYLFSLPMWNFGIPYKLKHYIDVIAQPGQTFSFDPATGYRGLVTGNRSQLSMLAEVPTGASKRKGLICRKATWNYYSVSLALQTSSRSSSSLHWPHPTTLRKTEAAALTQAKSIATTF